MGNRHNDSRIAFIDAMTNSQLRQDSYHYEDLVITDDGTPFMGCTLPTSLDDGHVSMHSMLLHVHSSSMHTNIPVK